MSATESEQALRAVEAAMGALDSAMITLGVARAALEQSIGRQQGEQDRSPMGEQIIETMGNHTSVVPE